MSDSEISEVDEDPDSPMGEGAGSSPTVPIQPGEAGGWDLLKVIGICWSVELVLAFILIVASVAMGYEFSEDGLEFSPWGFMATSSIATAVSIWACWHFACRRYHRSLAEGLKLVSVPARVAWLWGGVGLLCGIVGTILHHIFPPWGPSFLDEIFVRTSADNPLVQEVFYPAAAWAILGAVVEEVYYRGFLYTVFCRLIGAAWAMTIIVLWFWLLHVPQYFFDPVAILMVGVASVLFTWLRHKYDSIWPSITCHVVYNTTVLAVFIVQVEIQNASV